MKFTIETRKLNNILAVVKNGVGDSRILPITEYIELYLSEGDLIVTATDMNNFITYVQTDVKGTDGIIVVKAADLIKLVGKTTKAEMSFELKDSYVQVKGNGVYKLQISDENFPDYEFSSSEGGESVVIDVNTLKKAFQINESAVAKELLMPCLTGYNVGSKCITTDGIKMCINNTSVIEEPVLLPQKLVDLIQLLHTPEVNVQRDDNKILFTTNNIRIFGTELDGLSTYPDITSLLDLEYESTVTVNKTEFTEALDRLAIFVDAFENYGVNIFLDKTSVTLQDLKDNSKEVLGYESCAVAEPLHVIVNLVFLQDLIKPLKNDVVTLQFQEGHPLCLIEGDTTFILSLLEDEEIEEVKE